MKKLVLLLSLMLSGCWYSEGCWETPQMVNCGPDWGIGRYQKPNTIGHTDSEQRWKDVEACGATRLKGSNKDFELKSNSPDAGIRFRRCMESKGYVYMQCVGMDYKPSQAICNL